MKILNLLVSVAVAATSFAQEIHLSKIGKPVYRKQRDNDLGIVVYKNGSSSSATILPREYFVLGDYNDTLELKITKNKSSKSAAYIAECTNCSNIRFEQLENQGQVQYRLSDKEDCVLFNVSYEQSPSDLRIAPQETELQRDKEIGYIRLQNTLIRYAEFPGQPGFNIGMVDMNHNGRADTSDFISLSSDEFFYSARRDRSKKIAEVKVIEIEQKSYTYQITDAGNFTISISPLKEKKNADLYIQKQLENINFSGQELYHLLDSSKYVVVSHWTEFSRPCTLALQSVIDLNETVPVIGIHEGNKDLEYINSRYGINFLNIQSTEVLENKLNLSGFPHYMVINENREIVLDTNDIEEVTTFFQK